MAAKKNGAGKKPALPAGFKPARANVAGFFAREKGNSCQGILRGSFKVQGKFGEKNVYRIQLTDGETQVGDGEMVETGATIGIDETGYTKVLGELDPGTVVFVRYDGKAGAGEKDPHVFEVGVAEGE